MINVTECTAVFKPYYPLVSLKNKVSRELHNLDMTTNVVTAPLMRSS